VEQSRAELSRYDRATWSFQDALRRELDLSRPIAGYERALALDAGNASASRRLGQIELSLGQYEPALAHLQAAYAARPGNNAVRQLYGEALIANGYRAEGRALWATVPNDQRQLDLRTYWYRHIGDEQRAAWMAEAASP
jgi:tetratricopeptide (TPR) repeat protein